jgi:8-oxo-dGTP pyrophosphatase MutT (NUDIX family)|tara:strand:- start:1388 stop:1954 length:567 start_codon:yes stop_codon:yes gene_type:complete
MVAASILPITIHNNKLHFLFGKENPMEDSAKGWSDFGGRVDKGETIIQAALREGSEELTGFLGDEKAINKTMKSNGGFHKIVHNKYNVHLFHLPYDENLPSQYNHNHKFLWERLDKDVMNKSKLFEKIEIKWFSIDDLKKCKKDFRGFYQEIVDIFIDKQHELVSFIETRKSNKSTPPKRKNRTRKNK